MYKVEQVNSGNHEILYNYWLHKFANGTLESSTISNILAKRSEIKKVEKISRISTESLVYPTF